MKLFTLLLSASMVLFIFSCSSISVNDVKSKISEEIAPEIAAVLECDKPENIKSWLDGILKVDEMSEGTTALNIVCSVAVKEGLPLALKYGVPSDWECKLDMATDSIVSIAEKACEKL